MSTAAQLRPLTILVVEDDPEARAFAHRVLGEAGYRVEAASQRELPGAIARLDPDLVLLDVGLEGEEARANGILVRGPRSLSLRDAVEALLGRGREEAPR